MAAPKPGNVEAQQPIETITAAESPVEASTKPEFIRVQEKKIDWSIEPFVKVLAFAENINERVKLLERSAGTR